jgi:phenylacetate-CoA ligase
VWNARRENGIAYWPLDRVLALQRRRVRAIVRHAYEQVPYYRTVMDQLGLGPADFRTADDLAKLPILTGQDVAQAPERFVARNQNGRSFRIDSSGTSGKSKSIYYDHRALFLCLANGHRQRRVLAHFTGQTFGYRELALSRPGGVGVQMREFFEAYSWVPHRMDFRRQILPASTTLEEQVASINRFRPAVIRGYGSYIGTLFRLAWERGLRLEPPKVICYGADLMPAGDRELIEKEYKVPVLSNYQAVEALRIGFGCEERRGFHLSLDNVAVRVVDDDGRDVAPGGRGHIVISNLVNRATVLLNYRLGDIVGWSAAGCPCGRTLPMIENIQGRSDDVVMLADGSFRHALVLLEGLRMVPGVMQVQLVQEETARFVINTVGRPDANHLRAAAELTEALRKNVDAGANVEVRWMDSIPQEPGQKLKAVISRVGRE